MFTPKKINEVEAFLKTVSKDSKIYLGCDSVRSRKNGAWYATYTTVLVVHINNRHGGKIFHHTVTERDFCDDKRRPSYRLMNEVAKVAQLYTDLYHLFEDRDVEVHLDINADPKHGSNCVMQQAMGYIQGVTGFKPKIKPEAWAASFCADRGSRLAS